MKNKIIFYCCLISLICWLIPFLLRIFFIEISDIENTQQNLDTRNVVNKIILSLSNNDNKNAFVLIFKNNLKGCILNMAGGVTLGLGTLINLLINGFCTADLFANSYKTGMSIDSILKVTLPHSFELIGFWLSGAIGFYIAWHIILFMRSNEGFTSQFYKTVGIGFLAVFLIILSSAFVEAYISVNNLK